MQFLYGIIHSLIDFFNFLILIGVKLLPSLFKIHYYIVEFITAGHVYPLVNFIATIVVVMETVLELMAGLFNIAIGRRDELL